MSSLQSCPSLVVCSPPTMDVSETQNAGTPLAEENVQAFCELLDQMRVSMSATRDIVKSLREKCVWVTVLA